MATRKDMELPDRSWRRVLTALGGVLKRGILHKSVPDSTNHLTGSDGYWSRAIAAQLGWPQAQPPEPGLDRSGSSGHGATRARPSVRDTARRPAEPEFEPVHGWTRRQLDDYLARNPGYRPTYEAELGKHGPAPSLEVNGSLLRRVVRSVEAQP